MIVEPSGGALLQIDVDPTTPGPIRGSNQSGIRAYNERLLLTLLRRHGPLAKVQIARMSGLSAQTVSVIMRGLEGDGLVVRGAPLRGKVGQPSVPIELAPDGAFFFGLKVGRRSTDLVLTDFLGKVVDRAQERHGFPTPDATLRFTQRAVAAIADRQPAAVRARLSGLGIAIPFKLWSWAESIGAPAGAMEAWRHRDIREELAQALDLPVYLQNDASAACGAELVFGRVPMPETTLHLFIGYFIGGGVVLNGSLFTGRSGNAGALGSMPLPTADAPSRQLIDIASLSTLERMLGTAGHCTDGLWESPQSWSIDESVLSHWIEDASAGIARAVAAASSVIDLEAALIDGWMPSAVRTRLVASIQDAFAELNTAGISSPDIREGTIGPDARALGAACLALSERFLVDQNARLRAA